METLKLFMLLLGAKPGGRHTEQHDIFFGIGSSLGSLVPDIIDSWPEAKGEIHIDAWREVNNVEQNVVQVKLREQPEDLPTDVNKLFFINLGGYKENEFEEYHYKMLVACKNKSLAIQQSKATAFYRHTGFKGAPSHVDDKYGVDVDDVYQVEDILDNRLKNIYRIAVTPSAKMEEDKVHLGYFRLENL